MVLGQLVRMSLVGPWSFMVCKIMYTLDEVEEDGSVKRHVYIAYLRQFRRCTYR